MTGSDWRARGMLVLVALLWGLNWPAGKAALTDLSPWAYRTLSFGFGAVSLLIFAEVKGIGLRIRPGRARLHLVMAGLLNIGGFGIFSAFAMVETSTMRAAFSAYTMPLWASLFAALALGERLRPAGILALLLGGAGLGVLLWPLLAGPVPIGIFWAAAAAISWAAGTVYLKWAGIDAHLVAVTAWQLLAGTVCVAIGWASNFDQGPVAIGTASAIGLAYGTLIGTTLAYLLWFDLVGRLPAATAGLGTLMTPVIGAGASMLLLGERPSMADLAGFALILAAALAALAPSSPRP